MPDAASLPGHWPAPSFDAQGQVIALAEQVHRLVATARGLFTSGRRVELTGLDRSVGLLCAKALDLQPQDARPLRAELIRLVADLDALSVAMRTQPA